ncbi:MAG: hypothetical protein WBF75_22710 [Pseudonocardiaceae bacterium]
MSGPVVGLGFVLGLVFRRGVGLGIVAGLGAGYGFVFMFELDGRFVATLVTGLGAGLVYRVGGGEPRRFRIASWRAAISRQVLGKGLVVGTGCGLVTGLGYGFAYELGIGLRAGLLAGLVAGCGSWFVVGLVAERGFGVVLGLWVALVFGLASGLVGLGVGVGVALTYPAIWQTTLAWRQLRRCGHVPAVSLMPFLEDARERGVLRTVGGFYQFRHATLQDQLAGQTTPSSAASRVP